MLEKSKFIPAGIIAKPHGVSGEVAIRLFPEAAVHDLTPSFIFIDINDGLVPYRVSSFRYKSDNVMLAKLPLLNSEEKIRKLMECKIYLDPEDVTKSTANLNDINTFTGYKIREAKAGYIGIIDGIQNISGNPLFIINGEKGSIMIPVAEEFIVKINDDDQTIEMNIPDGLLDLNIK